MKCLRHLQVQVLLVFLLSLPLHAGNCTGAETTTASDESTDDSATILILQDGGVLTGNISRTESGYLIRRGGSQIQVPTAKVLLACRTLAQAYEARRAEIKMPTAESHLSLATWCLQNGLKPQAARELADVRALEPSHPRLALLERRLAAEEAAASADHLAKERLPRATDSAAPFVVKQAATTASATNVESLSGPIVERFTRKVQPILVNNCTTSGCHQRGGPQQFQLDRALLHGLANRRSTRNNLAATLALVDREQPHLSPLLIVPRQTHGGMGAPIFGPRHASVANHLVEWVALVTRREPLEPETWPTVEAIGGVVMANNSEEAPGWTDGPNPESPASKAAINETNRSIPAKPQVHFGATFQPWRPRDEFDPEIFNRHQRRSQPIEASDFDSDPPTPTANH
jgi:hypothetical protein